MAVRELELSGLPQSADPPRDGMLSQVGERLIEPFIRGPKPAPQTPMGFYTDTTVCIGCKACEVACKQWNQLPADGMTWSGNSYDNTQTLSATSWRHVKFIEQFPSERDEGRGMRDEGQQNRLALPLVSSSPSSLIPRPSSLPTGRWLMMSDVCKHCATAPCQLSCPTDAILINEFANVYIQPDICNGCAYCAAACPFGVITRSNLDGHSHKCTLCYDRQRDGLVPACAKACPTESIQFGPLDELRQRARQRVEQLHERGVASATLYGDAPGEHYSELHSFYLFVDRPSTYGLPDKPFNPWLHMRGDYLRSILTGLAAAVLVVAWFLLGQ
jgi:formate dehydrogenase iron-sulfur subunit